MIYDGDCAFCRWWIDWLRARTGDRVEYRASREVAADLPEIDAMCFERAVQYVDVGGLRSEGAEAFFRAWSLGSRWGRLGLWLWAWLPGFALLGRGLYRLIAHNRSFFSRLLRLFR